MSVINLCGCHMMLLKLILCCGMRPSCYFSSLCKVSIWIILVDYGCLWWMFNSDLEP